jgi:hypothetical protein
LGIEIVCSPSVERWLVTSVSGQLLEAVAERARASGVFGEVRVEGGRLLARAPHASAEAWYRLETQNDRAFVAWVTPDRWLSHSIEADLMHTGDSLEELIGEELAELGAQPADPVTTEHFRDEAKLFVFRTPLPLSASALLGPAEARATDLASRFLLAYEAAFRELGDVSALAED